MPLMQMTVLNPVVPMYLRFLTRQEATYFHSKDIPAQSHIDEALKFHLHVVGTPSEGLSYVPILLKKLNLDRG